MPLNGSAGTECKGHGQATESREGQRGARVLLGVYKNGSQYMSWTNTEACTLAAVVRYACLLHRLMYQEAVGGCWRVTGKPSRTMGSSP